MLAQVVNMCPSVCSDAHDWVSAGLRQVTVSCQITNLGCMRYQRSGL